MIIGLTGFIGSGKTEVARFLANEKSFRILDANAVLCDEAERREIECTIPKLRVLRTLLEVTRGDHYVIDKLLADVDADRNYVIDSIKNPAEIFRLQREHDFFLVFVDAPWDTRAKRVLERHAIGDPKTLDEFKSIDDFDRGDVDAGEQTADCIKLAEYTLMNAGTREVLDQRVLDLLLEIDKRRMQINKDHSRYD